MTNYLTIKVLTKSGRLDSNPKSSLERLMLFFGCQKLRFRQQPTELLSFTVVIFLADLL